MKTMSSLMLDTEALPGCCAWDREPTTEIFRRGFELCVVARDDGEGTVVPAASSIGTDVLVSLPAVLSSSDLTRATAVTKSAWYVLSGSHRTSTLSLKLRPGAAARFQVAVGEMIGRGDRVALLLDREVVGVLRFQHALTGDELAIDASFFCEGTEREKEACTRSFARQINSTLD